MRGAVVKMLRRMRRGDRPGKRVWNDLTVPERAYVSAQHRADHTLLTMDFLPTIRLSDVVLKQARR